MQRGLGVAALAAGLYLQAFRVTCPAQTVPALPPGVQDVVKLVRAGLDEDVVLAHLRNAGAFYNLSADQLIYLHDQGVTPSEIKALLGTATAPAPATPVPLPAPVPAPVTPTPVVVPPPAPVLAPSAPVAPPVASLASFQAQLAPYGTWIEAPGLGLCWRPTEAATDPYWRPYCDRGHWVYTADGWFWQSDYAWGDVAFHYGRWHRGTLGWLWVPGYDWAPAWVCWRHAEGYCGWAPLPPSAVFRAGVGLWFGGRVAVDVDFGLGADAFTFVAYDHFWDRNLRGFLVPRDRLGHIFERSVVLNGYRMEHGRFLVEGLGRERVASLTRHDVRIEEMSPRGGFRGYEEIPRRPQRDEHFDRHER